MFADRLPPPEQSNPLSQTLAERRAAGREVIDLTESNPTRAGIVYPEAEILAALSDRRSLVYEPAPLGLPEARAAVARYYAAQGVTVDPAHIILTASTSEAYAWAFKLLCRPGDSVAAPEPSYPLFEFLAASEGVSVAEYALKFQDPCWGMDAVSLESAVGKSRARAILVVSPNNPTGSFLKTNELVALRTFAARHDGALISDEVFAEYAAGPVAHRAPSLAAETTGLALTFGGLSKSCGLPQMKLGWIVVSGEAVRRDAAIARLAGIADTYLSVSTPIQHAAARLLDLRGGIQKHIRHRCESNSRTLENALAGVPGCRVLPREGGWYAIVEAPSTQSDEEWALAWLREDGVYVHPGYLFGFRNEECAVVSLLTPEDRFAEGVRRMARSMRGGAAATSSS